MNIIWSNRIKNHILKKYILYHKGEKGGGGKNKLWQG